MKKIISAILLSGAIFLTGCDPNIPIENSSVQLSDAYIGTWYALEYDFVDGTTYDYTVNDLTTAVDENKTYKIEFSSDYFAEFNLAGTLKIKMSLEMVTENTFNATIVDQGLDTVAVGETVYWEIEDTDNSEIFIKAYSDSTKTTYWTTYRCTRTAPAI